MTDCKMFQIASADETTPSEWDAYVLAHDGGTIFHLSPWQKAVKEVFGHDSHNLVARSSAEKEIVGVLPVVEIKSPFFGHYLVSVPFAERGGVLADDPAVAAKLTDQAIARCKQCGAAYLELKNTTAQPDMATKSLYFNFSRPILPTIEENLQAIPRKSRAMVRKGMKAGLTADWGHHCLDEFYQILAKNYHRLGTPIFPKKFFASFLSEFGKEVNLTIIRDPSGRGVAAVMTFFYRDLVMPYYAGSLMEYRRLAPNDFMYWALMEYGCEQGFKTFDFGRSKVETGSYAFKKNWGFEPEPLAYQYSLAKDNELPDLSPANPRYAKKIELWRKMPFPLTKLIGPPLAKYLA